MDVIKPESDEGDLDADMSRREDRFRQAAVERERLVRHQRIAAILLAASFEERKGMIDGARQVVQRWRLEHLCSADYIDRWSEILDMPLQEMAASMVSDLDGWGVALRQNSPWVGIGCG